MRILLNTGNSIVIEVPTDEELENLILCSQFQVRISDAKFDGNTIDWGEILSLNEYTKRHNKELYQKYRLLLE